jgi:S-adenosylmethionine synthetase
MTSRDLDLNAGLLRGPPIDRLTVEVVERKGIGHPDSICDALAEALSVSLCASLVAQSLVAEVPEIAAAHCFMVSDIGRPIDQPQIVDVRIETAPGRTLNGLRRSSRPWCAASWKARATSPTSCSMAALRLTAGLLRVADPRFGSQR